ncbi:MAG: 3-deoxy-manno-octulosonate cytidylyltransferase [Proteobacteria bacterium]|nr:3-deoxy-manno-octulosonate cytidylyltransferase [Pseudomonadota bacterium]
MAVLGVIPARYASTRFPGKVLHPIAGVPMLQRVVEGARESKQLSDVWVATDDERVAAACADFDAPVVLTRPDHPTGTDRLAEAAADAEADVIVNIQGDEPLIRGFVIDAAVEALQSDADAVMSTLVHPAEPEALDDPNRVKVVLGARGHALWFSRSRIPALRDPAAAPDYWQHVGLYAYRRPFLLEYVALPPTPAERAEQLEQLRALEHGYRIRAGVIEDWQSTPVDVPGDVALVEARLAAEGRA